MTDTLLSEEVMESLTTPPPLSHAEMTLQVLRAPFDARIAQQVKRFGFEYEMFPNSREDEEWYSLDERVSWETEDYDPFDPSHDNCNCEECLDNRRDSFEDDVRDRLANEGYSNDQYDDRSDDVDNLVYAAHKARLIRDSDLHCYHCHCDTCAPTRTGFLLTAQEDCSVGVEFVSRILDEGDGDNIDEITEWVNVMRNWQLDGNWMPDGYESCGNHVHVESDILGFDREMQIRAFDHVNALYAVFDWTKVADGGCGRIRDYNSKPGRQLSGSWLSDKGYGTFEHRLWNTPGDPNRLWAHLGISIALNRWAFALVRHDPEFAFTGPVDPMRYGKSIPDAAWHTLTNNIDMVIAQITMYIPDRPEFNIARDVIRNLRPL